MTVYNLCFNGSPYTLFLITTTTVIYDRTIYSYSHVGRGNGKAAEFMKLVCLVCLCAMVFTKYIIYCNRMHHIK